MSGLIERQVRKTLEESGIDVTKPSIRIHRDTFMRRIPLEGTIAIGEGYMNGDWDADDLLEVLRYAFENRLQDRLVGFVPRLLRLWYRLTNPQSERKSLQVAKEHYDLGEDLYERMLGPTLAYSCAYWERATTLDDAEEAKFALIFQKLRLEPGMDLLDIGCGFGTFARYCARRGVSVVGVTISESQAVVAQRICDDLPVDILKLDYRKLPEMLRGRVFDRVSSIGMFEHVGPQNFRTFMEVAARMLRQDGLMLLHTIGKPVAGGFDAWIDKWIFPGGYIPSKIETREAFTAPRRLFYEIDFHVFEGRHYADTLAAWRDNFVKAWPDLKKKYADYWGGRFYRGWMFYLATCEAAFRYGDLEVHQVLLAREDLPDTQSYVVR